MITLNRRHFIAGLALAGTAPFGIAAARADDGLTLWGPPGGPSVALAHMVAHNRLSDHGDIGFKLWRTPDQLRAGLGAGTMPACLVPSYIAAIVANRGLGVGLLNVMSWGVHYLISSDKAGNRLTDLAGRRLLLPFKQDMPDLVTQYMMRADGMTPGADVRIDHADDPLHAFQMLTGGQADSAILPEPLATGAILQGLLNAVPMRRVLSLQDEWGRITGRAPRIPQAGMMIAQSLLEARPDLIRDLQTETVRSIAWSAHNPVSAGRIGADYMDIKAPVIEKSIPFSNLAAVGAKEARDDLEYFFTVLAEIDPQIIGGRLPDDGFYFT